MERKVKGEWKKKLLSLALSVLLAGSNVIGVMPDNLGAGITASAEAVTEIPEGYTPIYTVEDLYAIRANSSANYILMRDIDLSGTAEGGEWDGGNGWTPIPEFSGVLDGNGYTISNMHIFGSVKYAGFIECLKGSIKNLHFDNVNMNITGNSKCGALASYCPTSGVKTSKRGSIRDCSVSGRIISDGNCVGGIAGSYSGTITTSYNNSYIINNGSGTTGGILGSLNPYRYYYIDAAGAYNFYESYIENCYNTGKILCTYDNSKGVGGIIGSRAGTGTYVDVEDCINFADGGITGYESDVSDCYYPSGNTFGYGGTELTPLLMKQQSSYLGLDFENIWEMHNERPRLRSNPEIFVTKMDFRKNQVHSATIKAMN